MTMRGKLMVMIAPQIYKKHIVMNKKGEPMLNMLVQKVLDGI